MNLMTKVNMTHKVGRNASVPRGTGASRFYRGRACILKFNQHVKKRWVGKSLPSYWQASGECPSFLERPLQRVGSDTMLVAPVTIGDEAVTAAGSVITNDVPDGALGISRDPQKNIDGYAEKRRKRSEKE